MQLQIEFLFPTIFLLILMIQNGALAMFKDVTNKLIPLDTTQLNYGVAVTNVGEGDGPMEWIIAGYGGPNIVLQMNTENGIYSNIARRGTKYEALMDNGGHSIGVAACDIDGDGKEEIYFLNTNNRYSGPKLVRDRLFMWRNNRYEDLFEDEANKDVLSMHSGRSVACIDRTGNGKYGILLATYADMNSGKFELIEVDERRTRGSNIVLHSIAENVGINFTTGGRGIVVGPILGEDGFSDIYFVNEGSRWRRNRADNALFKNDGSGRFINFAAQLKLDDSESGRGVTLADFNNDELIDIAYGNWNGSHRLYIQGKDRAQNPIFTNEATKEYETASPIRTVIAADFDNDGILELLFNNIVWGKNTKNKLYKVSPKGNGVKIKSMGIGDALEQDKYGTGAAVADIDNDGVLELLISHGESAAQPLSLYHVRKSKIKDNKFIRVMPTTQNGAPARGSKITLTLNDGTKLTRIIDGGSGYLCQMEPVAHFGLGNSLARNIRVQWPDGHVRSFSLRASDVNKMHVVSFYGAVKIHEPERKRMSFPYGHRRTSKQIVKAEDSSLAGRDEL